MAAFKPSAVFSVPLLLLIPSYSRVQGVTKKSFPAPENGILFFGNFRTFGGTRIGTEGDNNGLYTIEDTATIETWYNPQIKSDCRIVVQQTGAVYDVFGEPENINLRNQFMKFSVKRIAGGA